MKKHIIILFFNVLIFPGSLLFAQPGKGDINVTMRGSIYKLQNQTGAIANVTAVKEQHFSITPSVDYFVSDHVSIGFEFGIAKQKQNIFNNFFTSSYYMESDARVEALVYQPSLRIGFVLKPAKNLHLQFFSSVNYAHINQTDSITILGGTINIPGWPSTSNLNLLEPVWIDKKTETHVLGVSVYPQLTYYISERVGLNLIAGGAEFGFYDWDEENNYWLISFSPKYWRVGLNVVF